MPVIFHVLLGLALLPFLLAWLGAFFRVRQFGHLDNHTPRLQQAALGGMGARVQGAQANAWEALLIFSVVSFIAFASGLPMASLGGVALVFLALRLLHAALYIADFAWSRSVVFAAGMLCCLTIVYRAWQAAG
ncbi:MAPEG family protein [Onishia taeanensis]